MSNRILKFRVWNTEDKSWCGKAYPGTSVDKNDYDKFENLIFQQCTGLFDKNGKEIFEGDILEQEYSKHIYQVTFENGSFMLYGYINMFLYGENEAVSVIGNIFENPELLTNK